MDFNQLSQKEQLDILHVDGVYVGKRIVEVQTVVLFQLYGFYIEVFYKLYRKEIDHIQTSDNMEVLSPYLNQVNVRDINKDIEWDNCLILN